MCGDTRKQFGNLGESKAVEYLVSIGYTVIQRNFRIRTGEIDIIAKDHSCGGYLVFIEIKSRRSNSKGLPQESVNSLKQYRIIKAAVAYINKTKCHNISYRFDVIAIHPGGGIEHIKNAFTIPPGTYFF
ncbi:MAG: YraN family protein [Elusimicrobiota bacterium]